MTRKLSKILVVLGLSSATLFSTVGCDTFLSDFVKDFDNGFKSVVGQSFFDFHPFLNGLQETDDNQQ